MHIYQSIEPVDSINKALDPFSLTQVPDDWYIIITDVVGSTRAIESGRYKDVNVSGGLAVMAITNAFKGMQFPFVFGGDGVTILIPQEIAELSRDILFDTRQKVIQFYDLDLRIGFVPVKDLNDQNYPIRFGKVRISDHYAQAILQGTGVDKAEEWVKAPDSKYLITSKKDPGVEADFSGFTCRWQDIDSPKDLTIALIIKVRENLKEDRNIYYQKLLGKIDHLIGKDHHPLSEQNLKFGYKGIKSEAMATTGETSYFKIFSTKLKIRLIVFYTWLVVFFKLSKNYAHYDLKELKHYNIISSDYQKYDGTLKMIVAIDESVSSKLKAWLESEYKAGNVFYGIHISNRALLTCLLHIESESEVHFVDAADGGYALAAKELKRQIKNQ